MKKFTAFTAAALMSATAAAGMVVAPTAANAQISVRIGSPHYWTPERTNSIRQQIWQLDRQIDRAEQRRTISRSEARRLNREVRTLRNQFNRYSRDGLNFQEVRYLQDRVNRVRMTLRAERLDWDREDYWRGNRWRDYDRDGVHNRRDRDLDNDGVRNRYDRDIDGDGVPNRRDDYDRNPRRY